MKLHIGAPTEGDQLLATLAALANPHRMRVVAALAGGGRNYAARAASWRARSRHQPAPSCIRIWQQLQDAGLVTSKLELSKDGKALNYFEVTEFAFHLTPAAVADAAKTLTAKPET